MKSLFTISILSVVIFGITSCNDTSENDELLAGMESEVIMKLLQEREISTIDLDEKEPYQVVLNRDNRILFEPNDLFLNGPLKVAPVGDHLLIPNSNTANIVISDLKGKYVGEIGGKGRGPGEFIQPHSIVSNENYIYVTDIGLSRINVFDHHFSFKESYSVKLGIGRSAGTATSRKIILPAATNDEYLIQVFDAYQPNDKIAAFLPLLIPMGKQPSAYNQFVVTSNRDKIMYAYPGLPLLFIDNLLLKPESLLQFKSRNFSENQNPPAIGHTTDNMLPITRFFNDIAICDDGSLFLIVQEGGTVLIVLEHENNQYHLSDRIIFYEDFIEDDQRLIASNLSVHQGIVYLSSFFHDSAYQFDYSAYKQSQAR